MVDDTRLRCTTPEGVGYNHTWGVVIGNQSNTGNDNPGSANMISPDRGLAEEVVLLSSYTPPAVTSVAARTPTGLMATTGGDWVYINGTNFGPSSKFSLNTINATYGNPYLGDRAIAGVELEGAVYVPEACVVLSHESARCRTVPGIGSKFLWTIYIGDQRWPSRDGYWFDSAYLYEDDDTVIEDIDGELISEQPTISPAPTLSFGPTSTNLTTAPTLLPTVTLNGTIPTPVPSSSPTFTRVPSALPTFSPRKRGKSFQEDRAVISDAQKTSYKPPNIEELHGPFNQTNTKEVGATILIFAKGEEQITLIGDNFGPDVDSNLFHVYYHDPDASNKAGDMYVPECIMIDPHKRIRCTTLPGVGSNHTWRIIVGNQTDGDSGVLNGNTMTSYRIPEIHSIDTKSKNVGFSTRGNESVTLTGQNFGPLGPDNVVTAVYRSLTAAVRNKDRSESGVGPLLEGAYYYVTCEVTRFDTEVVCGTAVGVGAELAWKLEIAGQGSKFSTDFTKYRIPNVDRICSPRECTYTPGDNQPAWFVDNETSIYVPTGENDPFDPYSDQNYGTLATSGNEVSVYSC